MEEATARELARQIRSSVSFWHAEARHNMWTDIWTVRAWTDAQVDEVTGEPRDFYTLSTRGDWYRIQEALAPGGATRVEALTDAEHAALPARACDRCGADLRARRAAPYTNGTIVCLPCARFLAERTRQHHPTTSPSPPPPEMGQ